MKNLPRSRRKFLKDSSGILASSMFLTPASFMNFDPKPGVTVGEIMDRFIAEVPDAPFPNTVDTLKSGTREQEVTGVVTSMFATIDVIQKAIQLNSNFIIAHEPTYFNHVDETDWLKGDEVFEFKKNLLEESGIAVWRNHDYVHSLKVDGVQAGVVKQLGWDPYYQQNAVLTIPETDLKGLINHLKSKLEVPAMRYVGSLDQKISKVLLLPGAIGGRRQIEIAMAEKPDVIIVGESPEWETPEYVRNSNEMGFPLSMIAIGHSASEEGGSQFMAEWIKKNFPDLPIYHVPSGNSLQVF